MGAWIDGINYWIFVVYGLVCQIDVSPIGRFEKFTISGNYWEKFAKKANFFHEIVCGIKNYSYLCIVIEGKRKA